ncbi:MAG TPA: AGE family epimerase/isomerase [Dehalococcoidia bacterium]|nr:AGE family epimerase/isomerase [Dehalococcoidia bacterium]
MSTQRSDYRSKTFLKSQVESIVDFYYPACIDNELGGYINQFRDDGSIYDATTKHLVGTCRFIYVFATAATMLEKPEYLEAARRGVKFLLNHHRQPNGGYAWVLDGLAINDATNHCYGHAFVLLAYATALKAGITEAAEPLAETFDLMERHFWRPNDQLYVDEITPNLSTVDPYRGQNANMHTCEAMIAAFEATDDKRYIDRATTLAKRVCVDLAGQSNGMVWEHFKEDWSINWEYNIDDPKNLFRPYGYLVGHWTEWAKLLLILEEHNPEDWMLPQAKRLFDAAVDQGWDDENGGFNYSISPVIDAGRASALGLPAGGGEVIDTDRYYWVLSETIAAAGLLAERTGEQTYWDWYDRTWEWSLANLVDQQHGGWYRILDSQNQRYDDLKSPPSKTDYHPTAACWELFKRL